MQREWGAGLDRRAEREKVIVPQKIVIRICMSSYYIHEPCGSRGAHMPYLHIRSNAPSDACMKATTVGGEVVTEMVSRAVAVPIALTNLPAQVLVLDEM